MATLEAMILLFLTIFVMLFFMSYGFLFYQQWTVRHVANDIASRIAEQYAYPQTDPVMGFISGAMKASASPYRYSGDKLEKENQKKLEDYGRYMLHLSSMAYEAAEPEIKVDVVQDALAQRHLEVYVKASYKIPFGGALTYFGFRDHVEYEATSYAVCQDLSDYINMINTTKTLSDDVFTLKTFGMVDKIVKLVEDIKDYVNKRF